MGLGFSLRTDFTQPTFTIFSLDFHLHSKDDPSLCPFRVGLSFGLCGIHLDIGVFKDNL